MFSIPKPKASPKSGVSRTKGATQNTNPPKEIKTLSACPFNKGEKLYTPDAKVQDEQPKDRQVEEK